MFPQEKIKAAMELNGVMTFYELHHQVPDMSPVSLAKLLHEMVSEGFYRKKYNAVAGVSVFFQRYYTRSGSTIIFHYLDHCESEKFKEIELVEDMPWFFEPINYSEPAIYSTNFSEPAQAIAAAEQKETELK